MRITRTAFIVSTLILLTGAQTLLAQYGRRDNRRDRRDQRRLGVAVVSAANGDVRAHDGRTGDWTSAYAGMVLERGDRLATGRGSQAEVEFGAANFARLNAGSEVELGDLGNRSFRLKLVEGELTYSVWKGGEADVYIEADDLVIRPLKSGAYRVRTNSRQTVVAVRKGKAEVESLEGIETVKKGNRMTVRKRGDDLEFRVAKVRAKDQFDHWSERRDKILKRGGGRSYPGHLYAYGGYPYHFGLGYYHYPYRRFGFGVRTVFVGHRHRRHGRRY